MQLIAFLVCLHLEKRAYRANRRYCELIHWVFRGVRSSRAINIVILLLNICRYSRLLQFHETALCKCDSDTRNVICTTVGARSGRKYENSVVISLTSITYAFQAMFLNKTFGTILTFFWHGSTNYKRIERTHQACIAWFILCWAAHKADFASELHVNNMPKSVIYSLANGRSCAARCNIEIANISRVYSAANRKIIAQFAMWELKKWIICTVTISSHIFSKDKSFWKHSSRKGIKTIRKLIEVFIVNGRCVFEIVLNHEWFSMILSRL